MKSRSHISLILLILVCCSFYFPQIPFSRAATSPIADFSIYPSTAGYAEKILFDASSSSHPDSPLHEIQMYEWDFNNDGIFEKNTTEPIIKWVIPTFGVNTITLRVRDDNDFTDLIQKTVDIQMIRAPIAVMESIEDVYEGESTYLDGSNSYDYDSSIGDYIVSYEWDLNFDGIFTDATGAKPLILASQFAALGFIANSTHYVRLRVKDTSDRTSIAYQSLEFLENQPKAKINSSLSNAIVYETIQFSGEQSFHTHPNHTITSYEWDMDNDDIFELTGSIITKSWDTEGTYPIKLRVHDDQGKNDTQEINYVVSGTNHIPTAIIDGPEYYFVGDTIQLSGCESFDHDNHSIISYSWDMDNDGIYDEGSECNISIGTTQCNEWWGFSEGIKTIKLQVTDALGASGIQTSTITYIASTERTVTTFDLNSSVNEIAQNRSLLLDASKSYSIDPSDPITSYEWDFDGDMVYDLSTADPIIDHIFNTVGTISINLRTSTIKGTGSIYTKNIDVLNEESQFLSIPPVLIGEIPLTYIYGDNFMINLSQSYDTESKYGDMIKYNYDLTEEVPGFEYQNGNGILELNFEDVKLLNWQSGEIRKISILLSDLGRNSILKTCYIQILANEPIPIIVPLTEEGWTNELTYFNGTTSYHNHPEHFITDYEWDFNNDNIYDTNNEFTNWNFTDPGTYTIKLKVTDDQGNSSVAQYLYTINLNLPIPNMDITGVLKVNQTITFNASSSYHTHSPVRSIISYHWDIGNDGIWESDSPVFTHIFGMSGNYSILLKIIDDLGQINLIEQNIEIIMDSVIDNSTEDGNPSPTTTSSQNTTENNSNFPPGIDGYEINVVFLAGFLGLSFIVVLTKKTTHRKL